MQRISCSYAIASNSSFRVISNELFIALLYRRYGIRRSFPCFRAFPLEFPGVRPFYCSVYLSIHERTFERHCPLLRLAMTQCACTRHTRKGIHENFIRIIFYSMYHRCHDAFRIGRDVQNNQFILKILSFLFFSYFPFSFSFSFPPLLNIHAGRHSSLLSRICGFYS